MSVKVPRGEILWVSSYDKEHNLRYIITSKPARDVYYLYIVENDCLKKVSKDKNPLRFNARMV